MEKEIKDKIEEKAKEYATQMMGIGEYSERWHYGDKGMWVALMRAYKQGQEVGYSLAKEELPKTEIEIDNKLNEGDFVYTVHNTNGVLVKADNDVVYIRLNNFDYTGHNPDWHAYNIKSVFKIKKEELPGTIWKLVWFGLKFTCEEFCSCHTECNWADKKIKELILL